MVMMMMMSLERKRLLFETFIHVNKELDDFQVAVLRKVFDSVNLASATLGDRHHLEAIREVITDINQKIFILTREGWKPTRRVGEDAVLKPDHYDRFPMEPTYFLVESGGYHWCIENFCKYIVRFPFKNGLEDLGKAIRNLSMYTKQKEGDPRWSR